MSRVVLVSNPRSGGANREVLDEVAGTLASLGEVVSVAPGSVDTFADELAGPVEGADLVVVAGGDGTLNCAINGLRDKLQGVPLAFVPMGTGNDIARSLGIPLDPIDAARVAVTGAWLEMDIGAARSEASERLFVNACMGGFPVAVDEAIEGGIKERMGPLAFWLGGAKALADLTRYDVTVAGTILSDVVAVGVGNGKTAGGGISVFPGADPSDGELDACVMEATSIAEGLALVTKVRGGDHVDLPTVDVMSGTEITIDADPPLEFNVDGELVDMVTPVRFTIAATVRIKTPH